MSRSGSGAPTRSAKAGPGSLVLSNARAGAASLYPYADPQYYDHAYRRRRIDVNYYVGLAGRLGGPILEYGVGSGRVALRLARAGHDVVGVDLSRPMLARCAEQRRKGPAIVGRLELICGDMRRLRLKRRFPLVIAPFNAVQHLYTQRDVEAFLAGVRQHLAPGGRFVFDFLIPRMGDLYRDPEQTYRCRPFSHPTTGQRLAVSERFEYQASKQVLLVHSEFQPLPRGKPWAVTLSHRQFPPGEMEALLTYAGFNDIRLTADFTEAAPSAAVDSLVVSCKVADRRPRKATQKAD